ncbi:MAG: gamma carbonic anhydrase family protein [Anaerolineae bacterium]|nr:gamma carbonic anhydrase family protein [Anaerolineae bacterium]
MPGKPNVHSTAFVAPNAIVVGNVTVGENASIWFGSVLRAEVGEIVVGPQTNVQDLVVIHADAGQPCRLGAGVTVGHGAVLHGATVENGALIGIGAIVLDGAVIGEEAVIGAGSLVVAGAVIPPRSLALGTPARVVREMEETELARMRANSAHYVEAAEMYRGRNSYEEEGE